MVCYSINVTFVSFSSPVLVLVLGQCALLLLFSFPFLVFKVTEPEKKGGSVKTPGAMDEGEEFIAVLGNQKRSESTWKICNGMWQKRFGEKSRS